MTSRSSSSSSSTSGDTSGEQEDHDRSSTISTTIDESKNSSSDDDVASTNTRPTMTAGPTADDDDEGGVVNNNNNQKKATTSTLRNHKHQDDEDVTSSMDSPPEDGDDDEVEDAAAHPTIASRNRRTRTLVWDQAHFLVEQGKIGYHSWTSTDAGLPEFQAALEILTRATNDDEDQVVSSSPPPDDDYYLTADVWLWIGHAHSKLKHYDEAARAYTQTIHRLERAEPGNSSSSSSSSGSGAGAAGHYSDATIEAYWALSKAYMDAGESVRSIQAAVTASRIEVYLYGKHVLGPHKSRLLWQQTLKRGEYLSSSSSLSFDERMTHDMWAAISESVTLELKGDRCHGTTPHPLLDLQCAFDAYHEAAMVEREHWGILENPRLPWLLSKAAAALSASLVAAADSSFCDGTAPNQQKGDDLLARNAHSKNAIVSPPYPGTREADRMRSVCLPAHLHHLDDEDGTSCLYYREGSLVESTEAHMQIIQKMTQLRMQPQQQHHYPHYESDNNMDYHYDDVPFFFFWMTLLLFLVLAVLGMVAAHLDYKDNLFIPGRFQTWGRDTPVGIKSKLGDLYKATRQWLVLATKKTGSWFRQGDNNNDPKTKATNTATTSTRTSSGVQTTTATMTTRDHSKSLGTFPRSTPFLIDDDDDHPELPEGGQEILPSPPASTGSSSHRDHYDPLLSHDDDDIASSVGSLGRVFAGFETDLAELDQDLRDAAVVEAAAAAAAAAIGSRTSTSTPQPVAMVPIE